MINQNKKGGRGEREFAALLKKHGFNAYRSQQFCGANGDADITCPELSGFHFEVKRTEKMEFKKFNAQARADCDARIERERKNGGARRDISPVVVHRYSRGKWMAVIEAEELLKLLKITANDRGEK